MDAIILPIVLLVIIAIFTIVFVVVTKKQKKKLENDKKSEGNGTGSNLVKTASSSKNSKSKSNGDVKREDMFKFMDFEKIIDNMIVQKNSSRYTMAIKCKGINYDLMSDVEQMAVEEGFITFLNTLKYPIQFYVQAQNIDLKSAIAKYKENVAGIKDEYENIDYEYTRMLERFDTTDEEINAIEKERNQVLNVYEYASDIINYVERMSFNKNLLQRSFYILVSYNKAEIAAADSFSSAELESICYTELLTRCQGIINALSASSVEGKVLDSNELADLLYTAYNRDDKGIMNVREAIDSGFYRLYSTSKDAFYKKTKLLNEQIENEARIKAIEALKDSIKNGTYSSPTTEQLEVSEQVSKIAVEMIKNENVPENIKNDAKKSVIEEYKIAKRQLMEQLSNEQEAILNSNTETLAQKVGNAMKDKEAPKGNDGIIRSNESNQETNNEVNNVDSEAGISSDETRDSNIYNEPQVSTPINRNLQIETNVINEDVPDNIQNETAPYNSSLNNANTNINRNQDMSNSVSSNSLFDERLGGDDEEDDEII